MERFAALVQHEDDEGLKKHCYRREEQKPVADKLIVVKTNGVEDFWISIPPGAQLVINDKLREEIGIDILSNRVSRLEDAPPAINSAPNFGTISLVVLFWIGLHALGVLSLATKALVALLALAVLGGLGVAAFVLAGFVISWMIYVTHTLLWRKPKAFISARLNRARS